MLLLKSSYAFLPWFVQRHIVVEYCKPAVRWKEKQSRLKRVCRSKYAFPHERRLYVIYVYSLRIYSRILLQRNNSREKYLTSFVNILRIPSRLVFSFRALRLKEDIVRNSLKRSSKKKFSLRTDQLH